MSHSFLEAIQKGIHFRGTWVNGLEERILQECLSYALSAEICVSILGASYERAEELFKVPNKSAIREGIIY